MENIKIPFLRNEKDAKEKAGEFLSNLFNEQILTIDSIKLMINECHKKENQYSLEVFNKIEHNISELDSSLKAIDQMILNMTETSQKQNQFYEGWKKITDPINVYGTNLEKLMLSKKNVSLMLHNLNMYVRVQDQIKEMKQLLEEDDSNIVSVFKQIRYLSYLRIALFERVKTQERSEKLNNLADHLMCVQKYEDEFFEKFWSYFEDPVTLARDRPEFLVKLLRIIEEDPEYIINIRNVFKTYNETTEQFKGIDTHISNNNIRPTESVIPRETEVFYNDENESLKETLKYKIPQFIKEHFQKKFADKGTREEILDETLVEIEELYTIKIKVVPCFPPSYNIFTIYRDNYLNLIKEKIKPFLKEEELENSPGLLIPIAHWLSEFDGILNKIGINLNDTDIVGDVEYYMHLFYDHINNVLDSNLNIVIQKNIEDKKELKNNKKLELDKIQSYYASDVYNSLVNVLDLLSGDFKGQLLFQIVKTLFEKISLLIKSQEDEMNSLKNGDELIVACVYVSDASKCLEVFPSFKKKCKSLLPKDLYQHIKLRYINSNPSILGQYNNSIKIGCNKVIELLFQELSKNYLNKMFTKEWDDEILNGIFGTFEEYFNKGFVKILKTQNNLLIIVRCFIDSFVYYYIEELIHSIRSLNRKTLKSFKESALVNYQIRYLYIDKEDIVYKEKKKKENENQNNENNKEVIPDFEGKHYKNLNVKENKENPKKYKKYNFPVKKFNDEDKTYDPLKVIERVKQDKELFEQFLDGFSEECQVPFSKFFSQTLGENFIKTFVEKMNSIIQIMNCHESALKEQITNLKKYYDVEAKALCEALLYVRSDTPEVTKPEKRVIYLSAF